jgi:2-methylisocitrate lyase-like PEP mutase family enzyme
MPAKAELFRELHREGCFVIPNPWDIGSAKILESLGFKALATSSSAFAFSCGKADYEMDVESVLDHVGKIAASSQLPVNADFEDGFGDTPEHVFENVRKCAQTGVSGLSIEDFHNGQMLDASAARDRLLAAREACPELVLTARTEFALYDQDPLAECIRRLQIYAETGADVLFAPGIADLAQIRTLTQALNPKPVNVLVFSNQPYGINDLAQAGARRISLGSSLARAAISKFISAARQLADAGRFDGLADNLSLSDLNKLFASRS